MHIYIHINTYVRTYIPLHYSTLHYSTLHYINININMNININIYITLHFITLHYIHTHIYVHVYIYIYSSHVPRRFSHRFFQARPSPGRWACSLGPWTPRHRCWPHRRANSAPASPETWSARWLGRWGLGGWKPQPPPWPFGWWITILGKANYVQLIPILVVNYHFLGLSLGFSPIWWMNYHILIIWLVLWAGRRSPDWVGELEKLPSDTSPKNHLVDSWDYIADELPSI